MQSQAPTRFDNVTHEENAINARWLSPLIALAFAINPVWGANNNTADKHVAAKKHHKSTKKSKAARAVPARNSKAKNTATVPAAAAASAIATTSQGNPYLPVAAPKMAGVVVVTPMAPAAVLVQRPVNPYLQPMPYPAAAVTPPQAIVFPAIASTPTGESIPSTLTFLPNGVAGISSQFKSLMPTQLSTLLSGSDGESHWPISFKTVYPTGEKPLWVLTLKCPTEAAFGVAPPPVKLVHIGLTAAMDGMNYTGLLPVNLQQVCQ